MNKYHYIVSGGTFDHFHTGHKAFIDAQLAISEKVLIGITSDSFALQKEKGIEGYQVRHTAVKAYIASKNATERVELAEIEDGYIPSVWNSYPIDAIAVTPDTVQGAEKINTKRQQQGLSLLTIYPITEVIGEDGNIISSRRIRQGEINRVGELYSNPRWEKETVYLPDSLRDKVAKPFSTVYTDFSGLISHEKIHPDELIIVGDVVGELFQKESVGQKVTILDLYINRKKHFNTIQEHTLQGDEKIITAKNPAGSITPELFSAVKKSIFGVENYIILVDGEEDLAVLPSILVAPLTWMIIYGQPGAGIVAISVTEEKKQEAKKLLEKFTILASK